MTSSTPQKTATTQHDVIHKPKDEARTVTDRPQVQRMLPFLVPVTLLVGWELFAQAGLVDVRYFSSPSRVVEQFARHVESGALLNHLAVSLQRILVGFLAGAIPGLLVGLLMGVSKLMRSLLSATINAVYPLPKIALIPLFLMIFGLTENAKYATIATGVFFPVLINSFTGVSNLDRAYTDVATTFGASKWQFYRGVALPGAVPFIFAGLRIAFGVALLLIVAAEIIGTTTGIGYLIWNSWQTFRIEDLFIGLTLIAVLGILGNIALRVLERVIAPWNA